MSRSGEEDKGKCYKHVSEHRATPRFKRGKSATSGTSTVDTSVGNTPPGSPPPTEAHFAVAGKGGMGCMKFGYEGEHEYGVPKKQLFGVPKSDKPETFKRYMSDPSEKSFSKQKARIGSHLDSGRSTGSATTYDSLQEDVNWGDFDYIKGLGAQKAPGVEKPQVPVHDLIARKKAHGWDDAKEEAKEEAKSIDAKEEAKEETKSIKD
jgi:hypothetical protein